MILFKFKFHSASLSHLKNQFALVDRDKSNIIDCCNYIVPNTNWMVEMPLIGGQYNQAYASLWISHLVENLPLTPVMLPHLDSAQLTNPRQITSDQGSHQITPDLLRSLSSTRISQLRTTFTLIFIPTLTTPTYSSSFPRCHITFRFHIWWFGSGHQSA